MTADAGAGAPVGTIIVVCSNQIPSNYLPLGTQYDTSLYPILYALLGTDTTPTASALGLPTLTSGQYAIKATSGLSENAQDNVVAQLNEQRSYSTEEINTGEKWIDGKPIYRKVIENTFTSGTNTITHNLSIDNYIKVEIFIRTSSTFQNTKGYFNEQNRIVAGSLATNNFNVTTNGWIGNGYIILEYTKTT